MQVNGTQPNTIEEKLKALEDRVAAFEKKYLKLDGKDVPIDGVPKEAEKADSAQDVTAKADEKDKQNAEEEIKNPSRVKILYNSVNPKTGEREDQLSDKIPEKESSNEEDSQHAFVLRKLICDKEADNVSEIEIKSDGLWKLLGQCLGSIPGHNFGGKPVTLESPYPQLIYEWDNLQTSAKEQAADDDEKQNRSDLQLLLDTIQKGGGDPVLETFFKDRDACREQKTIVFDNLWTLFKPGILVYGRPFQDQHQLFLVHHVLRRKKIFNVICYTYDWNGHQFKRMSVKLEIKSFDRQKPIESLPFYPFEYHDDQDKVLQKLKENGTRYHEVCTVKEGARMFNYKGSAIYLRKGFTGLAKDDGESDEQENKTWIDSVLDDEDSNEKVTRLSKVDGPVMVDFESYFLYGGEQAQIGGLTPYREDIECQCQDCQANKGLRKLFRSDFDDSENQEQGFRFPEQYLLCPPRVLGYVLREKQWAQLKVTSIVNMPKDPGDDSWNSRLKLGDDGDDDDSSDTKDMILNLVKGHENARSSGEKVELGVDDIVDRKGKGLVILLYGPPGVGKTTTAETVAIQARKPLFSISVADVGTKAKHVENNLRKIFDLATSWQAILLIDEADVFLESRGRTSGNSIERNALVSVFLRVLEYYQGILILTTNQIAQFDVAVYSRIHVAIKYRPLNKKQTKDIFEGFLVPLRDKNKIANYKQVEKYLREDVIKKAALDGRQIRNVVTSALSLARATDKSQLDLRHLKTIISNVTDFRQDFNQQMEKYKEQQKGMVGETA
ncbi:P-loop containing nucleoside triphosphate hydrolase protein [Viridothelium virens]|uniref:P-loop containing nucleoside triphosphate hydrolase protein n=1 Tax=Viridothelium virens TaxID=1048519 RepID=A0A6A6H506_VIRVR|nr:P-loop containing nucleoside triphosphate hydrolase protein [Viridothelium virens]